MIVKEIVKEKIASLLSGDEEIQSVEQLGGMDQSKLLGSNILKSIYR